MNPSPSAEDPSTNLRQSRQKTSGAFGSSGSSVSFGAFASSATFAAFGTSVAFGSSASCESCAAKAAELVKGTIPEMNPWQRRNEKILSLFNRQACSQVDARCALCDAPFLIGD